MRNISDLFKGRDDVHGYYGLLGTQATDRGKKTGKAATRREPVTPELWKSHLAGENRLGIVPILRDCTCWWFCIDVDHYQETGLHEDIAARIEQHNLPLVMTRSKSGGAHLWCFLSAPMKAADAIAVANSFKKKLALPEDHVDIFPAQPNADDVGNWMNMPYFGDQCHGTGTDGTGNLTLEEFEKLANETAVLPGDLPKIGGTKRKAKRDKTDPMSQLPPCILKVMEEGCVPEGYRDNFLTHVAVVFKRAFPDDWEERVGEWNAEYCDPPLDRAEVRKTVNSVRTKDFGYLCEKVSSFFCDKTECKKRDFGIKGPSEENNDLPIDSLEIIDGENPLYRVTLTNGRTFTCDVETIFHYQKFRKAALPAARRAIPNMKNQDWEELLNSLLEIADVNAAPLDTQMIERVYANFQRFSQGATTDSLGEALMRGLPFYDETLRHIVFRGDDLMQLIDRNLKISRDQTWVYMREKGTVARAYTVNGKEETLWCFTVKGDLWFDPNEGERA